MTKQAVTKHAGAYLTIGELAGELGVPQHILRYWETRFPQLRPLQRAGNRRYYRPEDVALAQRIHVLLNVEGFTVRGAQAALAGKRPDAKAPPPAAPSASHGELPGGELASGDLIARLQKVRASLSELLSA